MFINLILLCFIGFDQFCLQNVSKNLKKWFETLWFRGFHMILTIFFQWGPAGVASTVSNAALCKLAVRSEATIRASASARLWSQFIEPLEHTLPCRKDAEEDASRWYGWSPCACRCCTDKIWHALTIVRHFPFRYINW